MAIRFTCPNGHRLTSPDDRAGHKSKCPECGVAVQVPPVGENGLQQDRIVFLCPNGHRLFGPRSLEGRPGQCPHCGAKFRVPSRDDPVEEEEQSGSQILVGESPLQGDLAVQGLATHDDSPAAAFQPPAEEPAFRFDFNFEEPSATSAPAVDVPLDLAAGGSDVPVAGTAPGSGSGLGRHPLAELFMKLWDERSKGAFVELHLSDGTSIVPERFARHFSQRTHGVFAVKEPDGTHTVTVLAWDGVARICVRRVNKLPKNLFD